MRKDLKHIQDMLEQGAKDVAARQLNKNGKENNIGVRHLGNEHVSTSIFLMLDPILEPVDKVVYSTIRILSPQTFNGAMASYPTYDEICKFVNIGSHATVARALAILRVTKWLVSKQVRTANGTAANVYMTMDNPMDIVDIGYLDDSYFTHLVESTKHAHNRVRSVSLAMLTQYENDTLAGKDMTVAAHPIEQVLDATAFLKGDEDATYFGMDPKLVKKLKGSRYNKADTLPSSNNEELDIEGSSNIEENKKKTNEEENTTNKPSSNIEVNKQRTESGSSNIEEGAIAHSSNIEEPCSSSSSSLNITTTTTQKPNSNVFYANVEPDKPLQNLIKSRFGMLDNSQHFRIGRHLMRINENDRAPMVYQVSNRIKYGATPIKSPINYLGNLCGRLRNGEEVFSEFAVENYNESKSKPKKDPKHEIEKKLIELNVEAREAWSDLEAQKNNYKSSASEFNQKAVQRADKKLRGIGQEKRKLEQSLEEYQGDISYES